MYDHATVLSTAKFRRFQPQAALLEPRGENSGSPAFEGPFHGVPASGTREENDAPTSPRPAHLSRQGARLAGRGHLRFNGLAAHFPGKGLPGLPLLSQREGGSIQVTRSERRLHPPGRDGDPPDP